MDKAFFSSHDYDSEVGTFQINIEEVTGDVTALKLALATLRTATNALVIAQIDHAGFIDITWNTPSPTTDPFGQREIKWQLVVSEAVTGNKYASNEIPSADLALLENGSPYLVKSGAVVVTAAAAAVNAWITAFEAVAFSPAGNAISVWDLYQVGRNI